MSGVTMDAVVWGVVGALAAFAVGWLLFRLDRAVGRVDAADDWLALHEAVSDEEWRSRRRHPAARGWLCNVCGAGVLGPELEHICREVVR